jgi:hypothetical protein
MVSPGWVETEAAVALVKSLAGEAARDYAKARADLMQPIVGIAIGRPSRASYIYASNTFARHGSDGLTCPNTQACTSSAQRLMR